jgi:hypothetical protein
VPLNNAQLSNLTTSFQDLYAVPSSGVASVSVTSIICSNKAVTATDLTIALTNSSDTILSYLSFTITVPVGASFSPIPSPIFLKPGQKLRVLASAINALDISLSCVEFLS